MIKKTFRHSKTYLILFIAYLGYAHSAINEFETTRMKSTAGAGVGSILMDEATLLNPASVAFFNVGSVYLSKGSSERTSQAGQLVSETDNLGAIVSDAKGNTAGSLSYQVQKQGNLKRKRISAAMARPIKKKSAIGFSVRRTTDTLSNGEEEDYFQTTVGITHAISNEFTLGFVAFDPLKKRIEDSMGIFGVQYVFEDFISLILDGGANYYQDIRETFLYKGALQFKLLDDFYARVGYSRDMGKEESGTGVGLGWVQPRLVIEVALRNIETFQAEESSETSFSLSYRF